MERNSQHVNLIFYSPRLNCTARIINVNGFSCTCMYAFLLPPTSDSTHLLHNTDSFVTAHDNYCLTFFATIAAAFNAHILLKREFSILM